MGFQFEIEDLSRMQVFSAYDDQDPVNAFAYYASFGAMDPKAPFVDAPATAAALGTGYFAGLAVAVATGMVIAGIVGFAVDPHHKHRSGFDEYYKTSDGDYYGWSSSGSYQEQPFDMNW